VVVLDVMLPRCDGFTVCRRWRAGGIRVPILLLTARAEIEDRVLGLDAGADDYLTKPFAFGELLARLRALSRRAPTIQVTTLQLGDLTLDPLTRQVARAGRPIALTQREFAILELLLRHAGRVLTRDQIAAGAWELDAEHASNVIDVFIRNLRRKIDDPHEHKLLHTIRGVGYSLKAHASPPPTALALQRREDREMHLSNEIG
jgi:two-component system OmpR family response regulator